MPEKIDGACFRNMVDYAVRNLSKHVNIVNQLNVFPVPDGDTGTNMVTTIRKGLKAIEGQAEDLPSIAKKLVGTMVFEARGNSGVIVSQFLKGVSEKFYDTEAADGALLIEAFERGVEYAYASVVNPVEGTMLTVMNDATKAVKSEFTGDQTVSQIIDSFTEYAKVSLKNTPELLSVLKETGVVDSGGAGLVYLFEGMKKYLNSENLEETDEKTETNEINYDSFNRYSTFRFGYCTELLLQLLDGRKEFDFDDFKSKLLALGESLVISEEKEKVRIHIHTDYPEKVFAYCHEFGEFLTSKIENMAVQHNEINKRILCGEQRNGGAFSVVAVAYDTQMQKLFLKMGADVALCCEDGISPRDYLMAFELAQTDNILVFPNSSNAILCAMQAKKLCQRKKVTILNSRGIAECYAALPAVDFEESNTEIVADRIAEVINKMYTVSISERKTKDRSVKTDNNCSEYCSFSGKELVSVSSSLEEAAIQTIKKIFGRMAVEIVTVFYRSSVSNNQIEDIIISAKRCGLCAEFYSVHTDSLRSELILSFE